MRVKNRHLIAVLAPTIAICSPNAFAGYTFKTLASFNGANGMEPITRLTVSGNTLYGTTFEGGVEGYGEVFSLPITGGTPNILANFNHSNFNLARPASPLLLSGNTLYGTTSGLSSDYYGTVFSVPVQGGTPTVLATFNGPAGTGSTPQGNIVLSGGKIYGATFGTSGPGTVFSVPVTGGAPTVLATVESVESQNPAGGVILSGDALYATTFYGSGQHGSVISIPTTGGSPTLLAQFNSSNGTNPQSELTVIGNELYGTGGGGQNLKGEVFSIPITGGAPTVVASFNGLNGAASPFGGLTLVGNTFYGTTYGSGPANGGAIYSVPVSGGTPTVLASFNGPNGFQPIAGLTMSGNTFYGTTSAGGANNKGTVFSLSPNPAISQATVAPVIFGNSVAELALTSDSGAYSAVGMSFTATSKGYVTVSGLDSPVGTEILALKISDSVPANLATDLAALAEQINAGAYLGSSVVASLNDPTRGTLIGTPPGGYNFYLAFDNPALASGGNFLGFDLSQLNGTSDILTATAAASTAVPEPAAVAVACAASLLLRRRNQRNGKGLKKVPTT